MNNQQAFDQAYKAIIQQGALGVEPNNGVACSYYTTNGLRCAVGHLLPEDVARNWQNVHNIESLSDLEDDNYVDAILADAGLENVSFQLLVAMQEAHDTASTTNFDEKLQKFTEGMRDVARRFNLSDEVTR